MATSFLRWSSRESAFSTTALGRPLLSQIEILWSTEKYCRTTRGTATQFPWILWTTLNGLLRRARSEENSSNLWFAWTRLMEEEKPPLLAILKPLSVVRFPIGWSILCLTKCQRKWKESLKRATLGMLKKGSSTNNFNLLLITWKLKRAQSFSLNNF